MTLTGQKHLFYCWLSGALAGGQCGLGFNCQFAFCILMARISQLDRKTLFGKDIDQGEIFFAVANYLHNELLLLNRIFNNYSSHYCPSSDLLTRLQSRATTRVRQNIPTTSQDILFVLLYLYYMWGSLSVALSPSLTKSTHSLKLLDKCSANVFW